MTEEYNGGKVDIGNDATPAQEDEVSKAVGPAGVPTFKTLQPEGTIKPSGNPSMPLVIVVGVIGISFALSCALGWVVFHATSSGGPDTEVVMTTSTEKASAPKAEVKVAKEGASKAEATKSQGGDLRAKAGKAVDTKPAKSALLNAPEGLAKAAGEDEKAQSPYKAGEAGARPSSDAVRDAIRLGAYKAEAMRGFAFRCWYMPQYIELRQLKGEATPEDVEAAMRQMRDMFPVVDSATGDYLASVGELARMPAKDVKEGFAEARKERGGGTLAEHLAENLGKLEGHVAAVRKGGAGALKPAEAQEDIIPKAHLDVIKAEMAKKNG